jgi:ubiquinol-cytochrome c reductase iron-sulfur subunit
VPKHEVERAARRVHQVEADEGWRNLAVRLGVLLLCGISAASAAMFVWVYWFSWGHGWIGGTFAVAVTALGIALVVIAHRLLPGGTFVEERGLMPSAPEEQDAFAADFTRGGVLGRRRLLWLGAGGALGAFALAALAPVRSLGPRPSGQLFNTAWRRGLRVVDDAGRPVSVEDVPVGGVLTVWPEGHVDTEDAQAVLLRVAPDVARNAEVPPQVEGVYVYSKICTHVGCPVGQYLDESHLLMCPCHQSTFDVLDDGKPKFGPAARALPQLPIALDGDGHLVATGDFPDAVGPSFWRIG